MISVIIVDYKTIPKTCQYIDHLYKMMDNPEIYHFIIVDNCSSNDGINYMNKNYKQQSHFFVCEKNVTFYNNDRYAICYIEARDNLGYAKGNNLGTEIADILFKDQYYIISNNDLRLKNKLKWEDILKVFESNDSIAVIGPKIVGLDGKEQSPYRKVSPFYLLIIYQWSRFWPFKSCGDLDIKSHNGFCYRVMGCFMIVKAHSFNKVGKFDSHTFMYGEEMILSERLLEIGFRNYYYNDLTIIHEHGSTVKKFSSVIRNDKWLYDSIYYYCKEYRNASLLLLCIARINRLLNLLVINFKEILKKIIRVVKIR